MFDILLGTAANKLRWLAFYLRNSSLLQFRSLVDIAVVDKLLVNGRFSINYLFLSMRTNQRLTVRLFADVTSPVLSLSVMFAGGVRFTSAVWLEREVWDMFGLYFSEHEDLRRILTDYGFSGHPLRKDFPLTGFYELVYNDAEGRIISEVVELAQEFRIFHI
jgi:NADH:ubiquinone oxidoreductase subunit C